MVGFQVMPGGVGNACVYTTMPTATRRDAVYVTRMASMIDAVWVLVDRTDVGCGSCASLYSVQARDFIVLTTAAGFRCGCTCRWLPRRNGPTGPE